MSYKITDNLGTHCCPSCGIPLTGAIGVDGENEPSEGDISVCFYCGEILTFKSDLSTNKISLDKLNEIRLNDIETYKMLMALSKKIKSKDE